MLKRVCCLFLSLVLSVSLFAVPARASAVGTIAGGFASLGLSASSYIPIIGAAFGVGVVVADDENRAKICDGIKTDISNKAALAGVAADYIEIFWQKASTGIIDTASDVWDACQSWAADTYRTFYDVLTSSFRPTVISSYVTLSNGASAVGTIQNLTCQPASASLLLGSFAYDGGAASLYLFSSDATAFSFDTFYVYYGDDHAFTKVYGKTSDSWPSCVFSIGAKLGLVTAADLPVTYVPKITGDFYRDARAYLDGLSSTDLFGQTAYGAVGPVGDMYADSPDLFTGKADEGAWAGNPDVFYGKYGVGALDGSELDMHDLIGDYGGEYTGADVWLGGDAAVDNLFQDLFDGTLGWAEFLEKIGAIPYLADSVPAVDTATGEVLTDAAGNVITAEKDIAIGNEGVTDIVITDTINPPQPDPEDPETNPGGEQSAPYVVDLRDFFPFCIPFDVYDMLAILAAEPVAPKVDWVFNFGKFGSYTFAVDLAKFDTVARLLRDFELLAFCIGLAMATKKLILNGGAG